MAGAGCSEPGTNGMGVESSSSLSETAGQLYEFEREPVPPDRLETACHFAAVFAGGSISSSWPFRSGSLRASFIPWLPLSWVRRDLRPAACKEQKTLSLPAGSRSGLQRFRCRAIPG